MADNSPPFLPGLGRRNETRAVAWMILGLALVLGCGGYFAYRSIIESGITRGPDGMFGDQNLKTAVALIELHKVRNGRYPENLSQLQFIGAWDKGPIMSVHYVVAKDGMSYFVEVERGWIGKPQLNMPPEFWRGTGYNPQLAHQR